MPDNGGMFDRLKKAVDENADKAEGVVGKVADAAKKATGGAHDDKIDKGAAAASDYLNKQSGEDGQDDRGSAQGRDQGQRQQPQGQEGSGGGRNQQGQGQGHDQGRDQG